MADHEFPREGIGMKEFFTEYVRGNVEKAIRETPMPGMDGTEFTVQFKITGETGYKYCLKITDGRKLDIIEGGIPRPMMEFEMSEADWLDGISEAGELGGALINQKLDDARIAVNRKNYDFLKVVRGKIEVEIIRPGQPSAKSITRFNQAEAPAAAMVMSLDDLRAIFKGEINSQVAFMAGKIKIKGDVGLLIKIAGLVPGSMKGKRT
ncbi:MAG: SCP2 sterol-binding domain-containing protein [bacterium]|nr:SCP2 sterol-binding domain-containing protein [bacterium]